MRPLLLFAIVPARLWLLLSVVVPLFCHVAIKQASAVPVEATATARTSSDVVGDIQTYETLLQDLFSGSESTSSSPAFVIPTQDTPSTEQAIVEASDEFNPSNKKAGRAAWHFLSHLASSTSFVQQYWQQQPLLIRAKDVAASTSTTCSSSNDSSSKQEQQEKSWVDGAFTVEKHLRMVENSYITGFKTSEGLRDGSDTLTWQYVPILSGGSSGSSSSSSRSRYADFRKALSNGTIYFNAAGSLWPNLGALCRLMQYAFGLPANVNVYATPPNVTMSVPPHTDRQDVFILQTAGTKHWRVYAPPNIIQQPRQQQERNEETIRPDPMERGKHGDVMTLDELGTPLVDVVLQPGDVLYVPLGFPHTTDTSWSTATTTSATADTEVTTSHHSNNNKKQTISVHLTMGLDTDVWCLTWSHLRSALLQRSGTNSNGLLNSTTTTTSTVDENIRYWTLAKVLPIGFVGGDEWRRSWKRLVLRQGMERKFRRTMVERTKELLLQLEPHRWTSTTTTVKQQQQRQTKDLRLLPLPSDQQIGEVIDFVLAQHFMNILSMNQQFFSNVDPYQEEIGMRAFQALQQNNVIMERFSQFSKNEAMRVHYAQKRLAAEAMLRGVMS